MHTLNADQFNGLPADEKMTALLYHGHVVRNENDTTTIYELGHLHVRVVMGRQLVELVDAEAYEVA
ncbi:MAG TPA: hypothetical protein VHL57_08440 [Flavobacteriales bacterium]|nr:hypothetical protein [Flavobacteriales bacterium]